MASKYAVGALLDISCPAPFIGVGAILAQTSSEKSKEVVFQEDEEVDYDTALDAEGYGLFSRSALGANIFAFFSGGMENCIMSYVLPAAKCDLQLTMYQTGLINMMFSAGGIVSALFWAIIGDVYGRRNSLRLTLIIDGLLTFSESMISDYKLFIVARCFNGFLIGAASALVMSYAADLIGPKKRNLYVGVVGTSCVLPWLVLPAVAWLVIPYRRNTFLPFNSWRLFLVLGSIPPLMAGIWLSFLPESPRFLMNTNRPEKALKALTKIYKTSFGKNAEYRVKKLIPDDIIQTNITTPLKPGQSRMSFLFWSVIGDLKLFVSKKYKKKAILIAYIFMANFAAGFGLNFWIPELMLRLHRQTACDQDYDKTNDIVDEWEEYRNNVYSKNDDGQTILQNLIKECLSKINDEVFIAGLIVGTCCVLGNAISSLMSMRSGPKTLRAVCAGFAALVGLAALGLAGSVCLCNGSTTLGVVSASVMNAGSLVENILLVTMILHAVPAKLSSLAVSWGCWWGRSGGMAVNFAVGSLLDVNCPAPLIGVAVLSALSIIAIFYVTFESISMEQRLEEVIVKEIEDIRRGQIALKLQK